jgi:Regulator of ribonuclease activity B/Family of unknown function (DUF695)
MRLFNRRKAHWDENWAVFPGELEGQFAMYFVDLGAIDAGPVDALPTRLDLTIPLPDAGEDGMPAPHELQLVQAIEDQVVTVAGKLGGAYVGRVLSAGTARLTCYLTKPPETPPPAVAGLTVEATTDADPAWAYLRDVLAPDEQQRHIIADLSIVQVLTSEGDRLDPPRPVDHTAFFMSAAEAEAAASELREQGFDVKIERQDDTEYLLEAVRVDPVAPPDLHDMTWSVRGSVETHGGTYDGWSCYVVR